MNVALINYGMGNLGSVRRSLESLGADVLLTEHPSKLSDVSCIVLPGVGAFEEGMQRLRSGGWIEGLQRQVLEIGKPLLGICLGMQMLATFSEENGLHAGLNFIPGQVRRLDKWGCALRIPHVGWNEVRCERESRLFKHLPQSIDFYFVHSYAVEPECSCDISATTVYGAILTAAIQRENIFGTQFHPEKSSKAGRLVLKNFLEFSTC
jgi:imidazole glycerol-phosphate synthase subunit HisH